MIPDFDERFHAILILLFVILYALYLYFCCKEYILLNSVIVMIFTHNSVKR